MKLCTKCGTQKELDGFYTKPSGRFGVASECKECTKTRSRSRQNGPKREEVLANQRKYSKAKHARIKDAVFAAYGGYVCACCGDKEPKFLTLDHVNNDGAAFRRLIAGNRQAAGYTTYRWLAKRGFPDGYQVLCMNCNHGKRMNAGICPHQTRCNDQSKDVGPSGPKRIAPMLKVVG